MGKAQLEANSSTMTLTGQELFFYSIESVRGQRIVCKCGQVLLLVHFLYLGLWLRRRTGHVQHLLRLGEAIPGGLTGGTELLLLLAWMLFNLLVAALISTHAAEAQG